MHVSSYSTFINTNSSQKVQREREVPQKESKTSFTKLSPTPDKVLDKTSKLPINYVSDYKVLNNQQKLQEETPNNAKVKFSKIKTFVSAKDAYTDNSKNFSLLVKPSATLDQTPKIDKKMPQEAQDAKEAIMKNTMVNTYIANDNYYKITA